MHLSYNIIKYIICNCIIHQIIFYALKIYIYQKKIISYRNNWYLIMKFLSQEKKPLMDILQILTALEWFRNME